MPYNEQVFSIPKKCLSPFLKNAWFHSKKCLLFFKFNERDIDHHPKWFGAREHETENLLSENRFSL